MTRFVGRRTLFLSHKPPSSRAVARRALIFWVGGRLQSSLIPVLFEFWLKIGQKRSVVERVITTLQVTVDAYALLSGSWIFTRKAPVVSRCRSRLVSKRARSHKTDVLFLRDLTRCVQAVSVDKDLFEANVACRNWKKHVSSNHRLCGAG